MEMAQHNLHKTTPPHQSTTNNRENMHIFTRITKLFSAAAIAMLIAANNALAIEDVANKKFTTKELLAIKEVNTYLSQFANMTAEFIQQDHNRNISKGVITISKPNKVRIDYSYPTKVSIALNDSLAIHYNHELNQIAYGKNTRKDEKFMKLNVIDPNDPALQRVVQNPQSIALVTKGKEETLKILFHRNPVYIKSIILVNNLNQETQMHLSTIQYNKKIDDKMFYIRKKSNKMSPLR